MVEELVDSSEDENQQSTSEESILTSERFWFAIDRQLLGSGLRLVLILPAFSFFTYFGALAFSATSPKWWSQIEPTLGISFAMALTALTFVLLLGYILAQTFHRHRVELSLNNFEQEVERLNGEHLSVQSLHGYESLADQLSGAKSKHTWSLSFGILSSLLLIVILSLIHI